MCTTGAKVLQQGREYMLFKNRDFTRVHFDDRLHVTDATLGVLGLETWDGDDPSADRFSGFSIGFNAHLACCDSNVKGLPDGANYDQLVQAVVENCTSLEEAIVQVRKRVRARLYSWGNVLVVSKNGVAALEIRDHHVEVERNPTFLVRTNHHVRLGPTPDDDDTTTTEDRYRSAGAGLKTVQRVDDVFPILRSHHPDRHHSVCNHGLYNTVYSYVVHWKDGATTFYVHQGPPCDGSDYAVIPFKAGTDLSAYPSARVTTL